MARQVERKVNLPRRVNDNHDALLHADAILREVAFGWHETYSVRLTDNAGAVTAGSYEGAHSQLEPPGRPRDVTFAVGDFSSPRQAGLVVDAGLDHFAFVKGTTVEEADTILASITVGTGTWEEAAAEIERRSAERDREHFAHKQAEEDRRRREGRRARIRGWFRRHAEAIIAGVISGILATALNAWLAS